MRLRPEGRAATATVAAAAVAWIVVSRRMNGMDMGPGTSLGSFPSFIGIWVVMMAAMMLPSSVPAVAGFARLRTVRGRGPIPTSLFVASYLLVWTAVGAAAYLVYRAVALADLPALSWHRQGALLAGAAIAFAGLYGLTPLKRACQRRCQTAYRDTGEAELGGLRRAVAGGAAYGANCVGCSAGFMLALFALGVMSITWMVVIGAMVFVQKVLPLSIRLNIGLTLLLVAVGVWVAVAPSTVPALVMPM
jgi:predicted metal-binding membrane protein